MKEKLQDKTLNIRWKIQILTIAPASWSRAEVAKFFNVSEYMVREARKLASDKGILEIPDPKRGKTLSPEIEQSVLQFYEDDEYSRLMPGAKDFVSVGKKVHVQKRLLLCNLNELYAAYKQKYSTHKIQLSKFCSLRPKWCVTVSSYGTHSVCVCSIHQNSILMTDALSSEVNKTITRKNKENDKDENRKKLDKYEITYKDLMKKIVYDIDNLECMIHRCENCPVYDALQKYLENTFEQYDLDTDEEMSYTQWDSTDRTTLRTHTASIEDFIESLVYKIDNLTTHSFIARSQSQYLKQHKTELNNT